MKLTTSERLEIVKAAREAWRIMRVLGDDRSPDSAAEDLLAMDRLKLLGGLDPKIQAQLDRHAWDAAHAFLVSQASDWHA